MCFINVCVTVMSITLTYYFSLLDWSVFNLKEIA